MSFRKHTFVLSLICIALLFSNEVRADGCNQIKSEYQKRLNSIFRKYEQLNPDIQLNEKNLPVLNCGEKNEAVYILHGFIGTPEEMSEVAESLTKKGYTVLNDLIPGHAADASTANEFNEVYWQSYVTKNISLLRQAYDKIHFIGFSTGALLIHNYLFENRNRFTAASTTLYSPFYKPGKPFIDTLNVSLNNFIHSVSIRKIYSLTRFREIEVAILKPENYQTHLPLITAEHVVNLGERVSKKLDTQFKTKIGGRALVFLAKTDGLIDLAVSKKFSENSFLSAQVKVFNSSRVPHHLMVKEVSPVASEVLQSTIDMIESDIKNN